jgi:DNA polymerase-3 subunit alpha
MRELFRDFRGVTNTLAIGERCNLDLEFGNPNAGIRPEGKTREGYLRELCYKGLHERYSERATAPGCKQLDYELSVLERPGSSATS